MMNEMTCYRANSGKWTLEAAGFNGDAKALPGGNKIACFAREFL